MEIYQTDYEGGLELEIGLFTAYNMVFPGCLYRVPRGARTRFARLPSASELCSFHAAFQARRVSQQRGVSCLAPGYS